MAHRLRRVIAVNIRNAGSNAASQQIAMLDLCEHTMAVGENGVGKSSFMRLIPLFYGAAPERILRGTQKHNLIGYTLPAPSSAVAYEYERESQHDLRLVVMYAKPGVERPEFLIVDGGYKEAYFIDENDEFVDRDRFKDRVEAVGMEVSPRLELHEYRSVILNENRHTKEARSLRPLAARHALGPRSLYGLDLIAVAMTSEKLSFRDLQNLVLDRLSDSGFEGTRGSTMRQLRKDRRDVDSWLANVRHAREIFNDTGRKKTIEEHISRIGQLALDLGSLRVATERSIDQRAASVDELEQAISKHASQTAAFEQEASQTTARLENLLEDTRNQWRRAKGALDELQRQQDHFDTIGAQALAGEEARKGEYAHDRKMAATELQGLTEKANDAQHSLQASLLAIDRDLHDRKAQIQVQREAATTAHAAQVELVEQERNAALEALDNEKPAPRLAEIATRLEAHQSNLGRHDALSKTADAPDEARQHLEEAERAGAEAAAILNTQAGDLQRAGQAVKTHESEQERLLQSLDQAEDQVERAVERHELLQAQLEPPAGTVLATLRARPAALWQGTAKVLDPQLLLRTDLQPRFEDFVGDVQHAGEHSSGGDSASRVNDVQVGLLQLGVAAVDLPAWATEDGARAQLLAAAEQLARARQAHDETWAQAKKTQVVLNTARRDLVRAGHEMERATTNAEEAKAALGRARNHLALERQRVRQEHAAEVSKLRGAIAMLSAERETLAKEERVRRASLRRQFDERARQQKTQHDAVLVRLNEEASAAESSAGEQRGRAQEEHDRRLAGLGVDPEKVKTLQGRIDVLDRKLTAIAENGHVVEAWRRFQRAGLPLKPEREARENELRERREALGEDLRRHGDATREQRAKLMAQGAKLSTRFHSDKEELEALRRLRERHLIGFRQHGPVYVGEGLHIDLNARAQQDMNALATSTQRLESATRELCSRMRDRPSPIGQWLDSKQAERDQRLQELEQQGHAEQFLLHERAVEWGRAVCEWFQPLTHREYHIALRHEMDGYFAAAESFVNHIANFESRVNELNRQFQAALGQATGFQRFKDLEINIASTATSSPALKALRDMRDASQSRISSHRTALAASPQLPTDDEIALVRGFREHLPDTGALQVNLDEQVRLTCQLTEMGKPIKVDNDRSMQGLSSTGLTVLITMMFLLGFVGIVRGPRSPVGLTWVLDEVGRVSPSNMIQYLDVLAQQNVTAVCAAPSIDPALGALFASAHMFEDDGSISRPHTTGANSAEGGFAEVLQ